MRYHGAWSEAATVGELRAALAAEENWLNDDDDDEASEATGSTAASSTSKDDERPPMLSLKGVASSGSLVLQLDCPAPRFGVAKAPVRAKPSGRLNPLQVRTPYRLKHEDL